MEDAVYAAELAKVNQVEKDCLDELSHYVEADPYYSAAAFRNRAPENDGITGNDDDWFILKPGANAIEVLEALMRWKTFIGEEQARVGNFYKVGQDDRQAFTIYYQWRGMPLSNSVFLRVGDDFELGQEASERVISQAAEHGVYLIREIVPGRYIMYATGREYVEHIQMTPGMADDAATYCGRSQKLVPLEEDQAI